MVCGKPLNDFLNLIRRFHGWQAPGLVLGGFMVDWARELVGSRIEADAIVETRHCLPDAVQLLTPCTIGNGWLQVLDWDKFALTLYDRRRLKGYRVWLDLDKAAAFPNIYNWYLKRVAKRDLPLDILLEKIIHANRTVLSTRPIRMVSHFRRQKKGAIGICPLCGEAYALAQGNRCTACQGGHYCQRLPSEAAHAPNANRCEESGDVQDDSR